MTVGNRPGWSRIFFVLGFLLLLTHHTYPTAAATISLAEIDGEEQNDQSSSSSLMTRNASAASAVRGRRERHHDQQQQYYDDTDSAVANALDTTRSSWTQLRNILRDQAQDGSPFFQRLSAEKASREVLASVHVTKEQDVASIKKSLVRLGNVVQTREDDKQAKAWSSHDDVVMVALTELKSTVDEIYFSWTDDGDAIHEITPDNHTETRTSTMIIEMTTTLESTITSLTRAIQNDDVDAFVSSYKQSAVTLSRDFKTAIVILHDALTTALLDNEGHTSEHVLRSGMNDNAAGGAVTGQSKDFDPIRLLICFPLVYIGNLIDLLELFNLLSRCLGGIFAEACFEYILTRLNPLTAVKTCQIIHNKEA